MIRECLPRLTNKSLDCKRHTFKWAMDLQKQLFTYNKTIKSRQPRERETRKKTGVVTRVQAVVGVEAVPTEEGVEVGIAVKGIEKGHHTSKIQIF